METRKLLLLVLLLSVLTSLQDGVDAETGFIFTVPKILRHGSTSEFCLTLHGQSDLSQTITMTLLASGTGKPELKVEDSFSVGKQKCKKFQVPEPGKYQIVLSNETEVIHEAVDISVLGGKLLTLVQTDKPMYKPGQLVKFRILTLMNDLKPRLGKIKSMYISDPQDMRVKQYLDVETQGISSLEFQLAVEAKIGKWKIEVFVDEIDEKSNQATSGEFSVMEYVLPRFEVEITPPSYIMADQKTVEGKVCAKYTYGKNVEGFLDLKLCWGSQFGTLPASSCVKEVVKISGCHEFSANFSKMFARRYNYFGHELQISASVTEAGTGAIVNKSHSGPSLTYEPLQIKLDDYSNGFFKPGLPFYGKAIITRPDGTPAAGEQIKITANDWRNNLKFSKHFTSDSSGVVVYSLCDGFTSLSKTIDINAEADGYPLTERLSTPRGYKQIKQWFSPSFSYIQIPRTDSSHKCGDRLTLSIPFTTRANTTSIQFNYQVMAQGKVVRTGQISYDHATSYPGKDLILPPSEICLQYEQGSSTPPPPTTDLPTVVVMEKDGEDAVEPPKDDDDDAPPPLPEGPMQPGSLEPIVRSDLVSDTVSNFLLDLPILPIMSPKFTLLVYHLMPDSEVVADSMQFVVSPCFDNQVDMQFSNSTVLPGENVDITVQAAAGSLCGIGVVDKSVNILGGSHQITPKLVFDRIEKLNQAQNENSFGLYPYNDKYCEQRIRKLQDDDSHHFYYTSPFVDAIQAFQTSGFMVLTNLKLETRPCGVDFPVMFDFADTVMIGSIPGPLPLSSEIIKDYNQQLPQTKIRTEFPETWLWDLQLIGETGVSVRQEKIPHTITNWVGNAVCLSQEKGFGISELTSVTTFQPFFLSLHLPYAAVRGERLPIMFTIYNYLDKCLHIQLTLDLGKNFMIHNSKQNVDPVCVCGGSSYTAKFYVTPSQIGNHSIFAQAEIIPGLCGNTLDVDTSYVGLTDAVKRYMLVKAEGVEQQYSHASYICSEDGNMKQESFILPLPEEGEMVKDSARGEVQVIGDIMGPALTNLNNLVTMPSGCGEQNMVGFVPNIFVLKYLTNTGRITEEIQAKAIKHMEIGYQRELTYRHKDGSYSAFGMNDPKGSVWLTAFVVKSFAQARPYIYIDEKELALSLKFLRHSQLETGCFRETGKVLSSYMMGGLAADKNSESFTSLTAYVLSALLKAKVNISEPVIVGALDCINKDFQLMKEEMDPYTLALVAYVNSLYEPKSRMTMEIINVLDSKAHRNGTLRYWSRETSKPNPVNTCFYVAAPSAEVEMTAYSLMANLNVFGRRGIERLHGVAMWMLKQRNPHGGFQSTQDTVVGLHALSEYASLVYRKDGNELQITASGKQLNESFTVSDSKKTSLLLQSTQILVLPNELTVAAHGLGCALVQANVRYNKQPKDLQRGEKPSFHLKVTSKRYEHDMDRCDRRTIMISVGRKGNPEFGNGMSLVSLKMVTSWSPISESLIKLKSLFPLLGIKKMEFNEEEAILTFYFDEFSRRPIEFNIDVEQDRDLAVTSPKPGHVKVFQYYQTDVSLVEQYELKTICGTKQEIPLNMTSDDSEAANNFQIRAGASLLPAPGMSPEGSKCPSCVPIVYHINNLEQIACNSSAIYKANAGRKGAKPLKLLYSLQQKSKTKLNVFVSYKLTTGCECPVLEPPAKQVLLFVREPMSTDRVLALDNTSLVIAVNKLFEKKVRKMIKSCPNLS